MDALRDVTTAQRCSRVASASARARPVQDPASRPCERSARGHLRPPFLARASLVLLALELSALGVGGRGVAATTDFVRVVGSGDPSPVPGESFFAVTSPVINDRGDIAFVATTATRSGLFLVLQGKLRTVVLLGDAAPGGGSFDSFESAPSLAHKINNQGQVAFAARVAGSPGIFVFTGSAVSRVAGAGDPTPVGGILGFSAMAFNNLGQVAFEASTSTGARGVFLATGGAIGKVWAVGDPGPDGTTFFTTSVDLDLNDAGRVAFRALVQGDFKFLDGGPCNGCVTEGIYLWPGGGIPMRIALSFFLGSEVYHLSAFGDRVVLNDRGEVLFLGQAHGEGGAGGPAGVFRGGAGGGVSKLAVAGNPAPAGIGASFGSSFRPSFDALNNGGEATFGATVTGGSSPRALFLMPGRAIVKLVAHGDPTPLGGTFFFNTTGPAYSFNNVRCVAFENDFPDAIWTSCDSACTEDMATAVPLGGQLSHQSSDPGCYKLYVPDTYGGQMTVTTDAGTLYDLKDPTGAPFTSGADTGSGKHGWFTFKVANSASYTVSTTFVQAGRASRRPWNFWYFPYFDGTPPGGPRLHEAGGALEKYDGTYGSASDSWEEANHKHSDAARGWEGHCWGAMVASILKKQPRPKAGAAGANLTEEELEGLYGEVANTTVTRQHLGYDNGGTGVPAIKPTAGGGDGAIDLYPDNLHRSLAFYIRNKKRPVAADLRDKNGASPDQVWNQAIFEYSAAYVASPGDPKLVTITTTVNANEDLAPSTDAVSRTETYTYVLRFKDDGRIDPDHPDQDWIGVAGGRFPPSYIWNIVNSRWRCPPTATDPCNPELTRTNVDALNANP